MITNERARRRPLRVINEQAKPQVRGVPSLTRVSLREAWLQVGDRYVITELPNRLYGVTLTEEGEAI